jgi:hypothetical protein
MAQNRHESNEDWLKWPVRGWRAERAGHGAYRLIHCQPVKLERGRQNSEEAEKHAFLHHFGL